MFLSAQRLMLIQDSQTSFYPKQCRRHNITYPGLSKDALYIIFLLCIKPESNDEPLTAIADVSPIEDVASRLRVFQPEGLGFTQIPSHIPSFLTMKLSVCWVQSSTPTFILGLNAVYALRSRPCTCTQTRGANVALGSGHAGSSGSNRHSSTT